MEQKIVRKALSIEGMTCTGCETRIENALRKLYGIREAEAFYKNSTLYIAYDVNVLGLGQIIETIEKLDYRVKNYPVGAKTDDERENADKEQSKRKIEQIIGLGFVVFALYIIVNNTARFNFIPQINQSMSYGILFVEGLLTSLHCIAMCGGINLSVCVQFKSEEEGSNYAKIKPGALYNLGRVFSYTMVGGLVGALGSVVSFSGAAKGIVAVISGVFMMIMGLNMLNIFPGLRRFNPRLPKFLARKVQGNAGNRGPLIVGLLNGLMPCGPLQAMQLYALGTGSFAAGAISMFLFSIGTVPLMFGFSAASSFLSSKFSHRMAKASGVLVMVLGIIMLNRGLNLSGFGMAFAALGSSGTANVAKIEDGFQVVSTKLEAGSYSPIIVQKGIPVKWTIKAEKEDLNGCNNPITIPKYNIEKKLEPGDNIIEFMPEEEGDVLYTCWMGMISSNIKVVADVTRVSGKDVRSIGNSSEQSLADSCCNDGAKAVRFADGKIPTDEIAIAKIVDGVQNVSINVNDYGFSPAVVVMQKGVQTNFIINGEQLNYCNSELIFPEYNARMRLKDGENKIEFVPEANFSFSCWMGMLNGYIKVTDNIEEVDIKALKQEVEKFSKSSAGSCGGSCCR